MHLHLGGVLLDVGLNVGNYFVGQDSGVVVIEDLAGGYLNQEFREIPRNVIRIPWFFLPLLRILLLRLVVVMRIQHRILPQIVP